MIHSFRHSIHPDELPNRFNNPFDYTPHPLCIEAAQEVQSLLNQMDYWQEQTGEGKMFGVLIVRTPENQIGFLAAFSGILNGSYLHPYFVPPIYNLQHPDSFFPEEESNISALNAQIQQSENHPLYIALQEKIKHLEKEAEHDLSDARKKMQEAKNNRQELRKQNNYNEDELIRESQHQKATYKRLQKQWQEKIEQAQEKLNLFTHRITQLKTERKQRSAQLQQKLFEQFRLRNAFGNIKNVYEIFQEANLANPPAGTGECAAPKLLQYAYAHQLTPIAMAEFWWGNSPKTEIRKQGQYYPACQGKCGPILTFMLQGLAIEAKQESPTQQAFPEIIYEDDFLLVLNKPAGMLSVPGKIKQTSVYELVQKYLPAATGPLLVHRLDMDTSGLLLIAKNPEIHTSLQHQFLARTIQKRYIALIGTNPITSAGTIHLPICPNLHDRPRQMVHETFGKPAITHYEVLERKPQYTRIAFYPETGRTHQLRVHAAHPLGLNNPILGDPLYGQKADRLYLHAEAITFTHPKTGQQMHLEKKAEF